MTPDVEQIVANAFPDARLLRVTPLGADSAGDAETLTATAKGAGYGTPLRIEVSRDGRTQTFVLHGASSNAFGHDRRADRAAELLICADTWSALPLHVQVLDVGAYGLDGGPISLARAGEFYLLTEYAEGLPYASDLRAVAERGSLTQTDEHRLEILASYLARLHQDRLEQPFAYARAARDLVGSGEGIFGILDSYPEDTAGASEAHLRRIESMCVDWRWKLKREEQRLVRIHGDFHPFNVLFDADSRLALLDASRGSAGDAADDVACMAVNFVFFALDRPATWQSAFSKLWFGFWQSYLEQSADSELLKWVAPYLAWRGLVLASPVWYPELGAASRARLLDFVEAALSRDRFDPTLAEGVFA